MNTQNRLSVKDLLSFEFIQALFNHLMASDRQFKGLNFNLKAHFRGVHAYTDKDGHLLYFKPRFAKDGNKWIKPMYHDNSGFHVGEPKARFIDGKKPLYNLPLLDKNTMPKPAKVYFVEGEKCADALTNFGITATTSGASTSLKTTDLTPLMGCHVVLWRDYDDVGDKWQTELSQRLHEMGVSVDVIDVDTLAKEYHASTSQIMPKGFDVFDYIEILRQQGNDDRHIIDKILGLPRLDAQAYHAKSAGVNNNDDLTSIHASTTAKSTTTSTGDNAKDSEKWGELIPFDEVKNVETPFPLDAFPKDLAHVIERTAYYGQVPLSMASFGVLGAISHIGQGFIDAPYLSQGYNPSSLYLMVQGESGSGKTQTIKITHKAINDHEKQSYQDFMENKISYENEMAGKTKKEMTAFKNQNHLPKDPRAMFGSGSIQKIMQGFTDGNYLNASYTIDEGANLLEGASLKSETAGASIGALCDIYSHGKAERITISNGNAQAAYDVRLTLFLSAQEVALKPALNDIKLNNQGLLPRCLFAFPPDNRGIRQLIKDSPEHDPTLQTYWKKCHNFLSLPELGAKRKKMAWQAPALAIAEKFWQAVEVSQTKGGINEHYKAYASRMVENATRIATLFAWFKGSRAIDEADILGAIKIVEYSMAERRRYSEIVTDITDAERLLQWLIKNAYKPSNHGVGRFFYSSLQQALPKDLRAVQVLDNALETLSDGNYVCLVDMPSYRRTKRVIELNPILLTA
ncbi:DUF3987 domain-containing protein [Moraxella nasovis]|uniref:DUF3987 domain-containing protein n=1 Tax=Moraxella nasovis TaxID=2904121 RepID=UPI001F621C7B|nr:DUF3987 domain-containing protein [Moraxella nasovis]UNU72899.1 DUF3987 domain-containing protein [Moraxella nasovis]